MYHSGIMFIAIVEFLFGPFFIGFTIWSVIYVLTKKEYLAGYNVEKADSFIARAVIFLGLIHVLITVFLEGFDADRAFGEYWFGYWIYPITYVGLTQLLWFDKIRKAKIVRLIMAVWFFVVIHMEKFIIIVTSFHRDFFTGDENSGNSLELVGYLLLNIIIAFLIFLIFVFSGMRIKAWIQRRKAS